MANDSSDFENAILPLLAITGEARWHAIGTAFVVCLLNPNQALVLTAVHNLNEAVKLDRPNSSSDIRVPRDFWPKPSDHTSLANTRIYVGIDGDKGMALAELEHCWHLHGFDVAVAMATLQVDSGARFSTRVVLNSAPPEPSTAVVAIGYGVLGAESTPNYDTGEHRVVFEKGLRTRSGEITTILGEGVSFYRWPGFLLNIGFDSGMSGGPILTRDGDGTAVARGMITGDLSEDSDNPRAGSGAHAFASMLWPALATRIKAQAVLQKQGKQEPVSELIDLVRLGLLEDRGNPLHHFRHYKQGDTELAAWGEEKGKEISQ